MEVKNVRKKLISAIIEDNKGRGKKQYQTRTQVKLSEQQKK